MKGSTVWFKSTPGARNSISVGFTGTQDLGYHPLHSQTHHWEAGLEGEWLGIQAALGYGCWHPELQLNCLQLLLTSAQHADSIF